MRPIDADALIKWLDNYYDSEKFTVGRFCNMVKDSPTIEERKTGRWIYHIDDLFPAESTIECNQCHAEQPLTCDDEFCPIVAQG